MDNALRAQIAWNHEELDPTIDRLIARTARRLDHGASETAAFADLVAEGWGPSMALNIVRAAAILSSYR